MKELFYSELRRQTEEARKEEERTKLLVSAFYRILDLQRIANQGGLFEMEEAAKRMEDEDCGCYLKKMVQFVCEGMEPELLEDIMWRRYFSSGLQGYDALAFLICLSGMLSVQAEEAPEVTEEKLKALLPENFVQKYEAKKKRDEEERRKRVLEEGIDMSAVRALCGEKFTWNPDEIGYATVKMADDLLKSAEDATMNLLRKKINNATLEVAMKGLGGEARENIFRHVSREQAAMLAADMNFMGDVGAAAILDAVQKILLVIQG